MSQESEELFGPVDVCDSGFPMDVASYEVLEAPTDGTPWLFFGTKEKRAAHAALGKEVSRTLHKKRAALEARRLILTAQHDVGAVRAKRDGAAAFTVGSSDGKLTLEIAATPVTAKALRARAHDAVVALRNLSRDSAAPPTAAPDEALAKTHHLMTDGRLSAAQTLGPGAGQAAMGPWAPRAGPSGAAAAGRSRRRALAVAAALAATTALVALVVVRARRRRR